MLRGCGVACASESWHILLPQAMPGMPLRCICCANAGPFLHDAGMICFLGWAWAMIRSANAIHRSCTLQVQEFAGKLFDLRFTAWRAGKESCISYLHWPFARLMHVRSAHASEVLLEWSHPLLDAQWQVQVSSMLQQYGRLVSSIAWPAAQVDVD